MPGSTTEAAAATTDSSSSQHDNASKDEEEKKSQQAAVAVADIKMAEQDDDDEEPFKTVTLIAKFKKEQITLDGLPPSTTILQVKEMLRERTRVLPKRQKLVGLVAITGGAKGVQDNLPLSELKEKGKSSSTSLSYTHQFILMGTPEEEIFVDPSERDDLPDVVDDFELDFNAGSDLWVQHVANQENLKSFTEKTSVHIMNPPRPGKPLLVLDLDHTLLDFSSRQLQQQGVGQMHGEQLAAAMKRPYMNQFLSTAYRHYDLMVWSQTSWRWLETKLIELGMVTHPGYKFCFVLDKTSMFTVVSTKRDGTSIKHHVKPLQIIWSKYPQWGSHNTCHIDDLSRNFALNLSSGLKIKAYYRKKSSARQDNELLLLSQYLEQVAHAHDGGKGVSFDDMDFHYWQDVVAGKRPLYKLKDKDDDDDDDDK